MNPLYDGVVVVAATSALGNPHLINGLFDYYRSCVPVCGTRKSAWWFTSVAKPAQSLRRAKRPRCRITPIMRISRIFPRPRPRYAT